MMWLLSVVKLISCSVPNSRRRRNCSHRLKFDTKHEGIGISDAANMARSRMFFPNYVIMIDFLINSCLIQQIQGGCAVLLDLVHCSFLEDEFDVPLFNWVLFFFKTYCRCRLAFN
ncbi:hypothetical protein BVRB_3g069970 [Beta vulgaris subsp. vulgaris]|nr:hypothetical protein BVRB_3g069970 [Beta vulgaris subsp. vulgaris]